jgi:hypothetical protein
LRPQIYRERVGGRSAVFGFVEVGILAGKRRRRNNLGRENGADATVGFLSRESLPSCLRAARGAPNAAVDLVSNPEALGGSHQQFALSVIVDRSARLRTVSSRISNVGGRCDASISCRICDVFESAQRPLRFNVAQSVNSNDILAKWRTARSLPKFNRRRDATTANLAQWLDGEVVGIESTSSSTPPPPTRASPTTAFSLNKRSFHGALPVYLGSRLRRSLSRKHRFQLVRPNGFLSNCSIKLFESFCARTVDIVARSFVSKL